MANIHIGIVSYAEIMVVNEWSVWIISIGAFVLPLIVCGVLSIWDCEFTGILSLVMLVITTIQLAINTVAIICVKDVATLQTYDLGVCITSGGLNRYQSKELAVKEFGKADIALIGGDNISDYPYLPRTDYYMKQRN